MQMHGLDEKSNRQRVWVADARLNFSELLKEGQMSLERLRLRERERGGKMRMKCCQLSKLIFVRPRCSRAKQLRDFEMLLLRSIEMLCQNGCSARLLEVAADTCFAYAWLWNSSKNRQRVWVASTALNFQEF